MEETKKKRKISDITKILIAMVAGSLVGIVVGKPAGYIGFIGDIWLNLMKMFLVPLVVCMLVKGITSMDSPETLGRIGLKIMAFYVFTTIVAGTLGVGLTTILNPGKGFTYETASAEDVVVNEMPSIAEFFTNMFSSNIFESFSSADMMQVLIIAVIIGVAIVLLPEGKREPVRDWFWAMSDLVMSVVGIALKLAPIGVFCLMASSLGEYGIGILVSIGKILGVFYLCCAIHLVVIYCMLCWIFTGINPVTFLKKAFPTFATAFSSCSSGATIPVSMDVATKNSQAMGIPMSAAQVMNLLFVTVLVTSAGSGVPGGGLMNLMIVGTAIGMPLDIVIMVGGFYRFFDMGTTPMNCLGDMSATVIIDRLEKKRAAKLAKKQQAQ